MRDLTLLTFILTPSGCALIYLHLYGSEREVRGKKENQDSHVNAASTILTRFSLACWRRV
jgi:hypothetical protein